MFRGKRKPARCRRPSQRGSYHCRHRFFPHRRNAEDEHHARGSAGTGVGWFLTAVRIRRQTATGKAKRFPRAGLALRFRSGGNPASGGFPEKLARRGTRRRRNPIQRRFLHSAGVSRSGARCAGALVRARSVDSRESGFRLGSRRSERLITPMCAPPAAECWYEAVCRALTLSVCKARKQIRPPSKRSA